MKKIIITFVISNLYFFTNTLLAQEVALKNYETVITKITTIAKNTQSISADFTQEKTSSYLKEKQISTGKFYTANNQMRWQQNTPFLYIMLINNDGIKIKNEQKEKTYGEMADKFMKQIKGIMMSSINGQFTNNKDFTPKYFENTTHYIVKLTPTNKRMSNYFKGINLHFDKKTYRLKVLEFIEENGSSKMYFKNEKFNEKLSNTLFTTF